VSFRHVWISLIALLALALGAPLQAAPPAPVLETAQASDPVDKVIVHIQALTAVIEKNEPRAVVGEFKRYVRSNKLDMQRANRAYETKLKDLSGKAATEYQAQSQRKPEKPLQRYLEVMLVFAQAHPKEAKELDRMLQTVQDLPND